MANIFGASIGTAANFFGHFDNTGGTTNDTYVTIDTDQTITGVKTFTEDIVCDQMVTSDAVTTNVVLVNDYIEFPDGTTQSTAPTTPSNYVTLDTPQTITAQKTFSELIASSMYVSSPSIIGSNAAGVLLASSVPNTKVGLAAGGVFAFEAVYYGCSTFVPFNVRDSGNLNSVAVVAGCPAVYLNPLVALGDNIVAAQNQIAGGGINGGNLTVTNYSSTNTGLRITPNSVTLGAGGTSSVPTSYLKVNNGDTAESVGPVPALNDNSTKIATTAWVQSTITSGSSTYVTLDTNQTITGIKTFDNIVNMSSDLNVDTIDVTNFSANGFCYLHGDVQFFSNALFNYPSITGQNANGFNIAATGTNKTITISPNNVTSLTIGTASVEANKPFIAGATTLKSTLTIQQGTVTAANNTIGQLGSACLFTNNGVNGNTDFFVYDGSGNAGRPLSMLANQSYFQGNVSFTTAPAFTGPFYVRNLNTMPASNDNSNIVPTTAWVQSAIANNIPTYSPSFLSLKSYSLPPSSQTTGNITFGSGIQNIDMFTINNLVYGQFVKVCYNFTFDVFNGFGPMGFRGPFYISTISGTSTSNVTAYFQSLSSNNYTQNSQTFGLPIGGLGGGLYAYFLPDVLTNYQGASGQWSSTPMLSYEFTFQVLTPSITIYLNANLSYVSGATIGTNITVNRYVLSV